MVSQLSALRCQVIVAEKLRIYRYGGFLFLFHRICFLLGKNNFVSNRLLKNLDIFSSIVFFLFFSLPAPPAKMGTQWNVIGCGCSWVTMRCCISGLEKEGSEISSILE